MTYKKFLFVFIGLIIGQSSYAQLSSSECDNPDACIDAAPGSQWFWRDDDGDGNGSTSSGGQCIVATVPPAGYSSNCTDCNDNNAQINGPTAWYLDNDGDGYGGNTTVSSCSAPAGYVANSDDCNDNDSTIKNPRTWYADTDGDGYGDPTNSTTACSQPSGYVANNDDCNDNNPTTQVFLFYKDQDGDGYGNLNESTSACTAPQGYVSNSLDCNDLNAFINPNTKWYIDEDGDGYGNYNTGYITQCEAIPGRTYGVPDCDDTDAGINPSTVWYLDADGDGVGDSEDDFVTQCTQPSGYVMVAQGLPAVPESALPNLDNLDINDLNYSHTIEPLVSVTTVAAIDQLSVNEKIETKVYHDGLGRVAQQVAMKQGGHGQDVITYVEYDRFGRTVKNYLPYGTLEGTSGSFRTDAKQETEDFYETANVFNSFASAKNPYSESVLDRSPLNRNISAGSPGTSWQIGNGNEVAYDYTLNGNDQVRRFKVVLDANFNPTLITADYYDSNELAVSIVKDENWVSGVNHTVEEYKNKEGLVVLKRSYAEGIQLSTYFVYDDYNNLTYVLPPKAEPQSNTFTQAILDDLCYQYKYDGLRRQISKRLPGTSGWEKIIYDREDRPVLVQDPNMALNNQWLFTKYDKFGRITYTGMYTTTDSQETIQNYLENLSTNTSVNEYRSSSTVDGISIGYSNQAFPSNNIELLTVSYYDDYSFVDADKPSTPSTILGQAVTTNLHGLGVANWTRTIGESTWNKSYSYYDEKGRIIRAYTVSHLGGYTYVDTVYDFRGKPLETQTHHKRLHTDNEITIIDKIEYDASERVKLTRKKVQNDTEKILTGHVYDAIGKEVVKYIEPTTENFGFEWVAVSNTKSKNTFEGESLGNWSMDAGSNGTATHTRDGLKVKMIDQGDAISGIYKLAAGSQYTIAMDIDREFFNPDLSFKISNGNNVLLENIISQSGKFVTVFTPDQTDNYKFSLVMSSANPELSQYFIMDNVFVQENVSTSNFELDLIDINALQKIDYKYNARGSITAINEYKSLGDDAFAYAINYDQVAGGATTTFKKQFNGNVSQIHWKTKRDNVVRNYKYAYDSLNRLVKADFSDGDYDLDAVNYDKGGNITYLKRYTHQGSQTFNYHYDDGNVLEQVTGTEIVGTTTNAVSRNYTYDGNGNLKSDPSKGVSNIIYNYLNLPERVEFTNGAVIEYDYDATGGKHTKRYIQGGSVTTTDYLGGFQYTNTDLQFIAQQEGYLLYNETNQETRYVYNYSDHLGNVRVSYSDLDGNGAVSVFEILRENNYYPYGMLHGGYNTTIHPFASSFNYGYGGKEHQQEEGIAWIDFGARNYDAELGRWFNIDPQAERYAGVSPFAAMGNNPIYYSDPNGEELFTAVLIGAAIGAAIGAGSTAIFNPQANFGDILGAGLIGAFSGAVTAGIGEAFTGGQAILEGSKLLQGLAQAGAHGLFQGTLATAQGGDFWQGALTAALSSGISSGIGNAGKNTLKNLPKSVGEQAIKNVKQNIAIAQALSGSFVGGFTSEITGGSFEQGFVTGITVAVLNHSLHTLSAKLQYRTNLHDILEQAGVEWDGKTTMSTEAVNDLINNVPELKEWHNLGGNFDVKYSSSGKWNELGVTLGMTKEIFLYKGAFKNNFRLASTLFHEFYHAFQHTSGISYYVSQNIGSTLQGGKGWYYLETQAYRFEMNYLGNTGMNVQSMFNLMKTSLENYGN